MPRALIILFLFFACPLAFAQNDCQKAIPKLTALYDGQRQPLISHEIKECPALIRDIRGSSRAAYGTSACVIFLFWDAERAPDLAVFDRVNDFELSIGANDPADTSYLASLLGDLKSGRLTFTKSENKQMTQATYDFKTDKLKLFKWKTGWFDDRYSHSYSVLCR